MDHTSYEWSQWWHKKARKPKRWKMAKNIIGFLSFLYLVATAAHPASSQSVQDWLQYLILLITLEYMFD